MSRYDNAAAQVMDGERQRMGGAAELPKVDANVVDLHRASGLPMDAIATDPDSVRKDLERQQLSSLATMSPAAAQWATDRPENYQQSRDDLDALGRIGDAVKRYFDIPRSALAALPRTLGSVSGGFGELYNTGVRSVDRAIDAAGIPNPKYENAPIWLRPGDALVDSGNQWKGVGDVIDAPTERRNFATDVSAAAGQLGGQIVQAWVAPQTLAPSLFAMGADQMAANVAETGMQGTLEGDLSIVSGAGLTAALEKLGIDKIMHRIPPAIRSRWVRRLADIGIASSIEAGTETAETLGRDLMTQVMLDEDWQIGETFEREAAVAGTAGGLVRVIAQASAGRRSHQQAQVERAHVDDLVQQSRESKLRQRNPEAFADMLETIQPGEAVHLSLEALQGHYGPRTEQAVATLTGDPSAFGEAQASGAELAIPLSRYLSTITPEAHAHLAGHLRLQAGQDIKPSTAMPEKAQIEADIEAALAELRTQDTPIEGITLADAVRHPLQSLRKVEQRMRGAAPAPEVTDTGPAAFLSPELVDANTWAEYQVMRDSARQSAEQSRQAERERQRERAQLRLQQSQRKEIQAEVEAEIAKQPTYRATRLLQAGKLPDGTVIKLNASEVLAGYGKAALDALPGMTRQTGGLHPDEAAALLGYKNGTALVHALTTAPAFAEVVRVETDSRMPELEDGYRADDGLDPQAAVLLTEIHAVERRNGGIRTHDAVLRETARRLIAGKEVTNVRPETYRQAEAKAAREAYAFASKGQWREAAAARRRQLQSLYLYREARNARDDATRIGRYLAQFAKKKFRQIIGKAQGGYLEQIDTLLQRFNFANLTRPQMAERGTLAAWIEAKAKQGVIVDVPPTMADEAFRVPFRRLKVGELRELHDAVRTIAHAANEVNVARVLDETFDLAEVDSDMAQSVFAGSARITHHAGDPTMAEKFRRKAMQARALTAPATDLARELDGNTDLGAVWRNTVGVMRKANQRTTAELKRASEAIAAIKLKHYTKAEIRAFGDKTYFPALGDSWSKGRILSLALNWGNEGNREAILSQTVGRLEAEQVGVLLRTLDARDWDFVRDTWKQVDSYWPAIAEAQKRRTGLVPEKVERSSFTVTTKDGKTLTMEGGYYPLKFLGNDLKTVQQSEADAMRAMRTGRTAKAQTRNGSVIERVGSGGKSVDLDLSVITRHHREIIRDLYLGDAVNYVYRVLHGQQFADALRDTGKVELVSTGLDTWLRDVAAGEMGLSVPGEATVRALRTNFTAAVLTFKASSALLQVTGALQTSVVLGKGATLMGIKRYLQHPVATTRHVLESSAFMRERMQTHVEAVQQVMDAEAGIFKSGQDAMHRKGFWMMSRVQATVDVSTWLAAERIGMAKFKDVDKARQFADDVVDRAQASSDFMEKTAIQRGTLGINVRQSEFIRATTVLQSYMTAKWNVAYARSQGTSFKSPTQVANWTWDMLSLFVWEGMIAAIIRGNWPGDEEEDGSVVDDLVEMGAEEGFSALLGGLPGVSMAASELRGYDAKGVVADAWGSAGAAWTQIKQGEFDKALVKAHVSVAGFLLGAPSSQINKTIDAIAAAEDGEDVTMWEYVTGPSKD